MIGKIVRLKALPQSAGFEVLYGLPKDYNAKSTAFSVSICSDDTKETMPTTIFCGDYSIHQDQGQEVEKILINDSKAKINKDSNVDTLLVIIEFGWFETTARKVAGQNEYTGVLEMHSGDIVSISKGMNYPKETYETIKQCNDLLLIKKD